LHKLLIGLCNGFFIGDLAMDDLKRTGVYCIRNTANGKRYVGSASISFGTRWNGHKSDLRNNKHHSILLQRAWNKYGESAFAFSICEYTIPEHAIAVEQVFLDFYKSYDPDRGYNVATKAGSRIGVKASEETRAKQSAAWRNMSEEVRERISRAKRAENLSDETRAKRSASRARQTFSAETRAKLSEALRRRICTAETRAKLSAASRGRKHSPESIERMAAANRGRKLSPEHVAKIAASNRGRKASDEHRAKISAANRGRKLTIDQRAKLSAAAQGRKHSDETRAKMSASHSGMKRSPEHVANNVAARKRKKLTLASSMLVVLE